MNIINRKDVKTINDACEKIQELYNSDNLSLSIATISKKSVPHKHEIMEEIYYIIKGEGTIHIGKESKKIKGGDLVSIPKNKYHYIIPNENNIIELVVVTNPGFDKTDVIT